VIVGTIDTNILIEIYRGSTDGKAWFAAQTDLALTSIAWLEFLKGARGKAGQAASLQLVAALEIVDLTAEDQRWARRQLLNYQFSHGVGVSDCLIASVAHRLQVPLYTKNVKDFTPILGASLVIKPY
jgi:predicted nucleic acid-binding protein